MLEKPKKEVRRTDTCQGHRPNGASLPPTILVSGRGNNGDTPHCMPLLSSAAATVITEPVFSFAATSALVVGGPCVAAVTLAVLALVVLLVVVIVAIAVIGLDVLLLVAEDVNVDDVVLSVVVFFVGRGLVEVSKWDVVM